MASETTLPPATTPGLTYWRCPACPYRLFARFACTESWDGVHSITLRALERLVEAHEAEHLTVTG